MTLAELVAGLKSLGFPVAYGEFEATETTPVPSPPFITVQYSYSSDLMADNHNYMGIGNYQIELYTIKKDLPREKLVEDYLKSNRIAYSKVEAWLDEEKMRQIIYEIQLIGG